MKIYKEYDASDVRDMAWSGAVNTIDALTDDQLESVLQILEDCSEEMSETELNDFLWFETDAIAEWLGFETWEHLENAEEIEEKESELEDLEWELEELEDELEDLKEQLESAQDENDDVLAEELSQDIKDKEEELEDKQNTIDDLRQEIGDLK